MRAARAHDFDPGPKWHYGVALLLGIVIATAFVATVLPLVYLYRDPDSSSYLEAARNFLAGRGLLVSTGLEKLPLVLEPISLWPPGYPLVVALGSKLFGIDPILLAPRIVWASWALLPSALSFTLRPVLRNWSIHIISALVMIAPGAIDIAWQPMTDIPFLLLTILSLGLLVRGALSNSIPWMLALSGLVGALAYSVRNAGIALYVSLAGAYAVLVMLKLMRPGAAIHRALWWGGGAALVMVPLEIRNLVVFGQLQPYGMAPSQIGLLTNVRYFFGALLTDITGRPQLTDAILWKNAILLLIGTGVLCLAAVYRKALLRRWIEFTPAQKEMFILLLANFLAGAAVVILARTRYQWGEFIGPRHLLQYDWILLAGFALLLGKSGAMSKKALAGISVLVMLLMSFRILYAYGEIKVDRQENDVASNATDLASFVQLGSSYNFELALRLAVARDRELMDAIDGLPADAVILSNYADLLRVRNGRSAHRILLGRDCSLPVQLTDAAGSQIPPAKIVILLFAEREWLRTGCWMRLGGSSQTRLAWPVSRPYLAAFAGDGLRKVRASVSP